MPNKPLFFHTKRELTISGFKGGSRLPYPDFKIPAGLRCKPITEGGTAGKFFLMELPTAIFPSQSFLRHDATHYGIVIEAEDVVDLTPKEPDWPTNKEMTVEAVLAFRKDQKAPYATAKKDEKLLTLYVHFDGAYTVVYDKATVFGPTEDLQAAIDEFNTRYGA